MSINPDAVGATSDWHESSWDSKDCLLYALSVGAGVKDPVDEELEFTTENTSGVEQKALPTMCVVLGGGAGASSPLHKLGDFNPAMLVHGEQWITLHKPLPVAATIRTRSTIAAIYDKGSGAVVVVENDAVDTADDQPMFTSAGSMFIRGEGGWGGDRGPSSSWEAPDRPADQILSEPTRTDQALLYRLNGDRNPLHTDKSFSSLGGFDTPILHGLCTYGVTGRALLHARCDSDPARFAAMYGRFSAPVLPGEQLDVHVWDTDDGMLFQTWVGDRVVLDHGTLEVAEP